MNVNRPELKKPDNYYKMAIFGNAASFVFDALVKGLKEFNIECVKMQMELSEISKVTGKMMVIIALDEVGSKGEAFLTELANVCLENKIALFLMGRAEEIGYAKAVIPAKAIVDEFKRPVNSRKVIKEIADIAEDYNRRKVNEKRHIMVVDDSDTSRRVIQDTLQKKYRVTTANSGNDALEFLKKGNLPDLILLDNEMPEMTGPQLLAQLRRLPRYAKIPVIFLTGKNDKESVEAAIELNPQGYILKTTAKAEIHKKVDSFFERQGMG